MKPEPASTARPPRAPESAAASAAGRVLPVGMVHCADNLPFMQTLPDGSCDLIYADPPFDPCARFGDLASVQKPGRYAAPHLRFLDDLRPRVTEMHRLLSERGSLYLHLDWRTVHHARVMLDDIFGPEQLLNEIIWSYRSGGRPSAWFARKHDTMLLYAKKLGAHTFNRQHGGSYRTQDLRTDDNGRPYKSTRNGPIHFHPEGPALTDVWEMPILSTVSRERTGYASQKPEALLERIIRASSNEGDVVADFFCGSGTTLAVAKRLNRRWFGCDVSPEAIEITTRRLQPRAGEG